ncbi:LysR family transcriptional regulator [Lentilactobacillus laojiaonis]|uniref:LysR family transcriptional regulator n=1 Tax=Lentilactobacillus laojiaonis TaxID=2883998 RepID=UPI001D0BB220|nr:LysR family transcriptional regulator [Lentilactobacillus laojiaonis]UDM32106.1 LysR family transcriptional regulator [Lentilactobacillus laojiaonis]
MVLDRRAETFLTLVDLKSYTKTAEKLYITQPTVTQQIKSLEKDYQATLVQYRGRHLTITNEGKELASFFRSIRSQLDKFQKNFSKSHAKPKISFSTTQSLSENFIPPITEYLIKHNYQEIKGNVTNTDRSLQMLRRGEVEFSLIEGSFPKDEFASEVLKTEPFVAVAAKDNPLSQIKQPIDFTDLFQQTLIIREPGSGSREIFNSILNYQDTNLEDFSKIIQVDNIIAIRSLLINNQGISFIYKNMVKNEIDSGKLVELNIKNVNVVHDLYFVYLKNNYYQPEYQQLIQWIKKSL